MFLANRDEVRKGQIAHLNRRRDDPGFENLVWLCLEHHDEFDSRPSQSKGLTPDEVRQYRDRLYRIVSERTPKRPAIVPVESPVELPTMNSGSEYEAARRSSSSRLDFISTPWRFPVWQVANEPELLAYKAGNRSDGICLIERINLPGGRIVIACIDPAGNPGCSITNCVEDICFQVCERFGIAAELLVWLEHYDYDPDYGWYPVRFEQRPPHGPFAGPRWTAMTPSLWTQLRLSPKRTLRQEYVNTSRN